MNKLKLFRATFFGWRFITTSMAMDVDYAPSFLLSGLLPKIVAY